MFVWLEKGIARAGLATRACTTGLRRMPAIDVCCLIMHHHDVIVFALQIGAMLTAALLCGQIMRALRQPAVVGELLGGICLGPTVLGTLAPHAYAWLFPATGSITVGRDAMLKIGMLFFMFVAGLEVNPTYLHQRGRSVVGTSLLGIVLPGALGVGTVLLMPEVWGAPAQEHLMLFALFMGVALSISALPVIARILLDLSLIRDEIGVTVLAAATIDDLIGWALFAMLLSAFGKYSTPANLGTMLGLVVGCMTLIVGLCWWRGRALLQWTRVALAWPSGFICLITIIVLIAAALAEAIGIHAIFGAFFVGVALGRAFGEDDQHAHDIIYQFAISFFAPLYFVSIGLKANFAVHFDLPLVLIVFVIACAGKIGGASLGAWLGGMPRQEALAVGFGMNARGAMEMILASVALEAQVIDQRVFVALITMALTTSMLSGPMMQRLLQKRDAANLDTHAGQT